MEFGVHLPHIGRGSDRLSLTTFARDAEALGYESAWSSDHIAWPAEVESRYPYSDTGDFPAPFNIAWLDPIGTLLFVAAVTERIRLGTTVLILGYRPPVQTAKLLATLDSLAPGRTILGVGVGWMEEEFEALGMPFDHRGARADEQLEVFEQLFTQAAPEFHGRFYGFPVLGFQPRPANGHIPVWVGGHSEAAFKRVAKYGDGLHAAFQTVDDLAGHWARAKALTEQAGRDPAQLVLSVRLFLDFDSTMDPRKSIQGNRDQMLDTIGRYAGIGVSHFVLDTVARGGVAGRNEAMHRFAKDIRPAT